MNDRTNNRRQFVKNTTTALGFLSLPGLLQAGVTGRVEKKKIVCVGGHPDDPESGCGGTLAKLANAGHTVTAIYLTTGDAGIKGKSHIEAAAVRKQEAINACRILQVKPVFAGQVDGDTVFNNEWVGKLAQLIAWEQPALVFTHWPLDTHKDHQVASLLTMQVWNQSEQKYPVYFFEVCAGEQTIGFHPTDRVDITEVQEQKRKALYCHVSQDPPGIYNCGHAAMETFRGKEMGVKAAEAFVKMGGNHLGGHGLEQLL